MRRCYAVSPTPARSGRTAPRTASRAPSPLSDLQDPDRIDPEFQRLTEAAAARSNAQARADAATGVWRRSSQEHDMAEELDNRRKQEAAYEARRVAERGLDELVAMRRKRGRS